MAEQTHIQRLAEAAATLGPGLTEVRRLPLPVYKTPRGATKTITGLAAEQWPYPRVLTYDGADFVEWPIPDGEGSWGLSFGAVRSTWNPISVFIQQFAEGRSSGFPFWSVVVFSLRDVWWALSQRFGRRWASGV